METGSDEREERVLTLTVSLLISDFQEKQIEAKRLKNDMLKNYRLTLEESIAESQVRFCQFRYLNCV